MTKGRMTAKEIQVLILEHEMAERFFIKKGSTQNAEFHNQTVTALRQLIEKIVEQNHG